MTYKLIVDGMNGNITVENKKFTHNNNPTMVLYLKSHYQ